jgi:hypothetical protein
MADEKISAMPAATDLIGADISIIQAGINKKAASTLFGTSSGALIMMGSWDASTNSVPNNGDITVKKGFVYDNGNFSSTTLFGPDGNVILPYATIRALVDNPGPLLTDQSKWRITY